jgi:hypothetical protein
MKVTSFTGVTQIDNVKIFKPVSKIFIKTDYQEDATLQHSDPLIRVRLVDGRNGKSDELVPEMRLSILVEIASKYEGFQRRAARYRDDGNNTDYVSGFDLCTVLLGGIVGTGVGEESAAIDLSNDKYLDIDMRELTPGCKYEIWGFENHIISPAARTYRKFYLSAGELEKTIHVEGNEVLVYPMDKVKEIQFYAKNGSSPVYRKEEFILDEDTRNDLVTVELDEANVCRLSVGAVSGLGNLPIKFGYSNWGVVDLRPYTRFDFRREDGVQPLTLLMIDTMPTIPTSVANTIPADELK